MRMFSIFALLTAAIVVACPADPPPIVVEGEGEEGEGEEGEGDEGEGDEGEGDEGEGEGEGDAAEGEGDLPPFPDTVLITPADNPGFCNPCQVQLDHTLQLTTFAIIGGQQSTAPATWSVDDDSIASVDDTGLVRGRALGTVTITATVEGASATADVEVIDGPTVDHVVVNPADLTLAVGENAPLNVQVFDSDDNVIDGVEVSFQSATPDTAAVDAAGLVTGLAVGDAFIVITAGSAFGQAAVHVTE